MSESDDEEFLIIFQNNNLEEVMNESEKKINLTIKDLHEGLTDLCGITAYLSNFLVEFFEAYEEGEVETAPKMKSDTVLLLMNIFETASCFIDSIDVESDDEEDNEEEG